MKDFFKAIKDIYNEIVGVKKKMKSHFKQITNNEPSEENIASKEYIEGQIKNLNKNMENIDKIKEKIELENYLDGRSSYDGCRLFFDNKLESMKNELTSLNYDILKDREGLKALVVTTTNVIHPNNMPGTGLPVDLNVELNTGNDVINRITDHCLQTCTDHIDSMENYLGLLKKEVSNNSKHSKVSPVDVVRDMWKNMEMALIENPKKSLSTVYKYDYNDINKYAEKMEIFQRLENSSKTKSEYGK